MEIDLLTILGLRAVGSIGGGIIAIVIVQPNTFEGLLKRAAVSLASGLMLEPALRRYLDWPPEPDNIIAAACIVAAIAWWIWHAVIRGLQNGWIPFGRNGKSQTDKDAGPPIP